MKTDCYTYTEADGVRRVEISSEAAGVSEPQVTVHETWLSNAENPHARGRVKMSQAVNGVQTHYEYAANAAYDAMGRTLSVRKDVGLCLPPNIRNMTCWVVLCVW